MILDAAHYVALGILFIHIVASAALWQSTFRLWHVCRTHAGEIEALRQEIKDCRQEIQDYRQEIDGLVNRHRVFDGQLRDQTHLVNGVVAELRRSEEDRVRS